MRTPKEKKFILCAAIWFVFEVLLIICMMVGGESANHIASHFAWIGDVTIMSVFAVLAAKGDI